jgi:hypothetical protein
MPRTDTQTLYVRKSLGLKFSSRPRESAFTDFPLSSRFAIAISTLFRGYISDGCRPADGILLICGRRSWRLVQFASRG